MRWKTRQASTRSRKNGGKRQLNFELRPVVETRDTEEKPSEFLNLDGHADEAVVIAFLQAVLDGNWDIEDEGTPIPTTIPDLVVGLVSEIATIDDDDSLSPIGGFIILADDFRVEPSCCCGLLGWIEWRDLSPGSYSPWLGHNPSPWILSLIHI